MFPTADPNASAGALSSLFGDDSDDDDSALAYQRKKAPSSLGARDGAKLQAAVAAAPEQVSGSAAFRCARLPLRSVLTPSSAPLFYVPA